MNPKISVVIPTRNEGGYIAKTLEQYRRVKDKLGLEIIISDGGSKDNTVAEARPLCDMVVLPVEGQKQNIPIGRNAGAKVARGEIIFNTDADVMIPNIEQFFTEILRAFEDPTVVGAMTPIRIYPEEQRLDDKMVHALFNSSIRLSNHFGSFLSKGECQFVRASTFRQIGGYDETMLVGEDCDMFYRLAKIGRIAYLKDLVVHHSPRRFRNDGYMSTLWIYAREGYSLLFLGKNRLTEWEPIR